MPDDIFGEPPIPPNATAAWRRIHDGLHDYYCARVGQTIFFEVGEDADVPPGVVRLVMPATGRIVGEIRNLPT